MKNIRLLIFPIILLAFLNCSEDEEMIPNNNLTASSNELLIVISNLQNNNGKVIIELSDESGNTVQTLSKEINNKTCIISFLDLEKKYYAFKYFHDENNNETLDTNPLEIPTEGYGFSNNASGTFGPPKIEDTLFEYNGGVKLDCQITYLF